MKHVFFFASILTCTLQARVIEIDGQQDLDKNIKEHPHIVLKFYRPACPHCKTIAADYEALSNSLQDITFLAVNTDKPANRAVFPKWGITGVPALFFVKNGIKTSAGREKNFRASFEQAIQKHFKQ